MKLFLTRMSDRFNRIIIPIIVLYIVLSIMLIMYFPFNNVHDKFEPFAILFIIFSTLIIIFLNGLFFTKFQHSIKSYINNTKATEFKQMESLINIHSMLKFKLPISTRGWAASPDLLIVILDKIIRNKPNMIVELGSGTSSLFIGQVLKENNPQGRLLSIDHSFEYSEETKSDLLCSDLSEYVEVKYCPLKDIIINEHKWNWYNLENLNISKIDLLIIDGPIGKQNNKIRYPAIPILIDNLKDNAIIILDDYNRIEEKEIVRDWMRENIQLKLIKEIDTEKGTAILQKLPKNK